MTPDDQIDAAELALGLLDAEARAAALEHMLADPAFAREVALWQERFADLLVDYADIAPPAELADRVVPRDADPAGAGLPRRWSWLIGGAVGGALAASLAALAMIPHRSVGREEPVPVAAPPPQPLIAVLVPTDAGERLPVAALIDPDGRVVRLTAAIVVPEGRAAEFWRIGADKTPRPLGLLSPGSRVPVLLDQVRLPGEGEVLAISIEPDGGSPTGKPTGPVIASGSLVKT